MDGFWGAIRKNLVANRLKLWTKIGSENPNLKGYTFKNLEIDHFYLFLLKLKIELYTKKMIIFQLFLRALSNR